MRDAEYMGTPPAAPTTDKYHSKGDKKGGKEKKIILRRKPNTAYLILLFE